MHHTIFERNRITGQWRAYCVCGWSKVGPEHEVKTKAATHDIDAEWVRVEPANAEAV